MPILLRTMGAVHTFLYRLSNGRVGGRLRNADVLLLTTTGRKSGKQRTTPLLYVEEDDRIVIVASNGGREKDPSWWTNLKHNPQAVVQMRAEKKRVMAEKAGPSEKERLWPMVTKAYPQYDDYQKKTSRNIPVVILKPDTGS